MTNEVKTKRRKTRSLEYSDSVWGYAFIMPMLIGFLIITVLPVIMTFVYSMTDKNMMSRTTNFIAMDNFVKLFSDKTFRSTMWQTLEFTVLLIPSNMILTLGLAIAVNLKAADFSVQQCLPRL